MGMSCAGQESMAELETPEGAEQAKHSSREGTQGSVDGVQRKEHFRVTKSCQELTGTQNGLAGKGP